MNLKWNVMYGTDRAIVSVATTGLVLGSTCLTGLGVEWCPTQHGLSLLASATYETLQHLRVAVEDAATRWEEP